MLTECGPKMYTGARSLKKFVTFWRGHGCPLTCRVAHDIMQMGQTVGVAYQLHHCMKQQGWWVGHHRE